MNFNYTLKYRTFDSLLEDVKIDLRNLSADTSIEPAQLLKVASRVNYDLGLRIYKTKEITIEICKNKAKLPDDFFVLNFALLCGSFTITTVPPQGTTIMDVVPKYRPWVESELCCDQELTPIPVCTKKPACLTQCGETTQLIQLVNTTQVRTYNTFAPLRFRNSVFVDSTCPNMHVAARDEAYIKDGWIYTTIEEGTLYINYQGYLVDEDNNMLVPDHPMLNEYYEYAIKKRILENLVMDNVNVSNQLQYVNQELRAARNNALTIVNTPNFAEMQAVWSANRKAQYARYYDMFKSHFTPVDFRLNNAI